MSINSSYELDQSAALARRYASLAASFLANPKKGSTEEAQVPLENLFRILEMYRYDAFSDENRRGVLAVRGFRGTLAARHNGEEWQAPIVLALEKALSDAFDLKSISKDAAIDSLVHVLQDLSAKGEVSEKEAEQASAFLSSFEKSLAA
jgi:hypothetical protein